MRSHNTAYRYLLININRLLINSPPQKILMNSKKEWNSPAPSLVLVTVVFRNEELTVRLAIAFLFTKIKNIKIFLPFSWFLHCIGTGNIYCNTESQCSGALVFGPPSKGTVRIRVLPWPCKNNIFISIVLWHLYDFYLEELCILHRQTGISKRV